MVSIEVVFETHALSEDNERGIATGWLPGRLCERGRADAVEMGRRRRDDVTTGRPVRELVAANFEWQAEGWEYRLA